MFVARGRSTVAGTLCPLGEPCVPRASNAGHALTPATEMRTYGTLSTAGSSCTGSTNNGDNRVEVVIQRSIDFNLLIAPPNVTIPVTGDNTTRFEPRLT